MATSLPNMSEEHLPVYKIRNFEEHQPGRDGFYVSTLEEHLQKHRFIQKPHKHDFYMVLLVTEGYGSHTIDFIKYEVRPGMVFFLSPGQVHSWQLPADAKGFILFFALDFYLLGFSHKKLLDFPFFNVLLRPFLVLPEPEMRQATDTARQIEQERRLLQWNAADLIRNLLDILLIKLSRSYQAQHVQQLPTPHHYSFLQQLFGLVEQHFREHKPVSFYARQLHVTQKQLNEHCRQSLGKTTSEVIQNRIILEARRLLIHSDLTVTQIAAELGYFDNSYFSRFYKKHTGETAEQFRKGNL